MIAVLYLGGVAFVVALLVAAALASNRRRLALVLVLGVVLAVAWFAGALLTANTNPNRRDCSDCEYVWGRWWWPPLVLTVLGLNLVAWFLGAGFGALVRRIVLRASGTGGARPS